MDSTTQLPDVQIGIFLDGQFVQAVRLTPDAIAEALAGAGAPQDDPAYVPGGPRRRSAVVEIPDSGQLHLALELRRPPPGWDRWIGARPATASYSYDAGPLPAPAPGLVTRVVYDAQAFVPPPPRDEPPDEPHIRD